MPDLGGGLAGCYQCAYVWRPRTARRRTCPRCKSTQWDVPRPIAPRRSRRPRGAGIEEVLGPHRDRLLALTGEFGATQLRVFGSVARGEAGPRSDLDLLVEFADPPGVLRRMEFEERLEGLLGRRVDLATEANLHWLLRPRVLAEAVPVGETKLSRAAMPGSHPGKLGSVSRRGVRPTRSPAPRSPPR
jgi:predicted nucleotidyltransferase